MLREEFEKLVEAGIEAIPKKFRDKLNNVTIVIDDCPSDEQLKLLNLPTGQAVFGLYQGVPQVSRGLGYSGVVPDKITIFQKPIENAAGSPEEIKKTVRQTIWHEIAHHFCTGEDRIRQIELKKRQIDK